jgi:glycosyltransferase involved in cell wall biosynthesis
MKLNDPLISIIYPIKNRVHLFTHTLKSLYSSSVSPIDVELIIIDQSSTDGLLGLLREYSSRFRIEYYNVDMHKYSAYKLPDRPYYNPAYVMNLGIRNSKGYYNVLTSPEVCPQFDVLAEIKAEKNHDIILQTDTEEAKLNTDGTLSLGEGLRNLTTKEASVGIYPAYNYFTAYPHKYLMAIGGIEESYMAGLAAEDDDFCDSITSHRLRYKFYTGGVCYHIVHPINEWVNTPEWIHNCEILKKRRQCLDIYRINNLDIIWGSDECIIEHRSI